jgi:hypothetical protein
MLMARDKQLENIEYYIVFINSFLESKKPVYKFIIDKVISETHDLITTKDVYEVSSEYYDIVTLLAKKHKDYFKDINTQNLNESVYKEIQRFLKEDETELLKTHS